MRLRDRLTIAPSQMRVVPIIIEQTAPFRDDSIQLDLFFISGQISRKLSAIIPVVHKQWGSSEPQTLKGTFFSFTSNPSAFLAVPPMSEPPRRQLPIIALRWSFYCLYFAQILIFIVVPSQMVQVLISLDKTFGRNRFQRPDSAG